MKTVSVSELKARLSSYLRWVRRGGEVQILERGVPIARITGLDTTSDAASSEARRRMTASGLLRAGTGDLAGILETPPIELPGTLLLEALQAERDDRL